MEASPHTNLVYCPQCFRRAFESDALFCPHDGAKLLPGEPPAGASAPSSDPYDGDDEVTINGRLPIPTLPDDKGPDTALIRPFGAIKMTTMVGMLFGDRYLVRGFVNKGATARVYLAQDVTSGEPVVIKLFAPASTLHESVRDRFLREANVIMHIDHPNVVKIRSVGEADGRPFIAMEALRGEPLGDYLRREGAMSIEMALPLFRSAMKGLAAAHEQGVVHRDVKPDNLFLLGDPGSPEGLKVIDFGMAKTRDDNDPQHGLVMGTVEYMSPEQVLTDPVDARTDVYSLGVVMFRALTGHLPFDVDLGVDLIAHQIFSPAPPISWLAEMVDPRLELLILTAMRKSPDNRYASMEALLADLDRILGLTPGEPVGAALHDVPDAYRARTATAREAAIAISTRVGLTPRST